MSIQRALQKELLVREIRSHTDIEQLKEDACLLVDKIYMYQDLIQKMHLDKLQEIRLAAPSPAEMCKEVTTQLNTVRQIREALGEADPFKNGTAGCQHDGLTSMPE